MNQRSALPPVLLMAAIVLLGALAGWWLLRYEDSIGEMPPIHAAKELDPGADATTHSALEATRTLGMPAPAALAEEASQPVSEDAEQLAVGCIAGEVRDSRGPVAAGAVVVHFRALGTEGSFECPVSADGTFLIERVPAGTYRLEVKETTLPGYLGPSRRSASGSGSDPPGLGPVTVKIPEQGGTFQVVLRVFAEAVVSGSVLGPDDEGVSGVQVRLQCRAAATRYLCADGLTDPDGRYVIRKVYPGEYRTQLFQGDGTPERYAGLAHPAPLELTVEEGRRLELPPLRLGGGSGSIEGVVLDQDELPVPDLPVLCYLGEPVDTGDVPHDWNSALQRVSTDRGGRFRLHGLPAVRVKVQIAPDGYLPSRSLTKNLLARHVPPSSLDLGVEPKQDLGIVRVVRSRPYVLEGRIQLDPQWAAQHGVRVEQLEVRVFDAATGASEPRQPLGDPEVGSDGTFHWECQTPAGAILVEIAFLESSATHRVEWILTPYCGKEERIWGFPR